MFCICVTINHIDVCSLAGVFKILGSLTTSSDRPSLGQTDYYPLIMIKPLHFTNLNNFYGSFFWHRCIFCEGSLHAVLFVQSWRIVSLLWVEGSFYEICCSFHAIFLFVPCISNLISSINNITEMIMCPLGWNAGFSNLLLQLDSKVTTSWISHSIVRTASVSSELLPILWFVSQYLWGYNSTNCFHVTLSCRIAVSWSKAERNNVFLEQ